MRKAAPFWNPELQALWQERSNRENVYTAYKCDVKMPDQRLEKSRLLNDFKNAQKDFDIKYRYFKRQHSSKPFHELADLAYKVSSDPTEMWKRLKALSDFKPAHVLLEVFVRSSQGQQTAPSFSECFDQKYCMKHCRNLLWMFEIWNKNTKGGLSLRRSGKLQDKHYFMTSIQI